MGAAPLSSGERALEAGVSKGAVTGQAGVCMCKREETQERQRGKRVKVR